ncbi:outer dense fiber protein 2-like [Xenia sp. Carnegie-2017]|uniref:outer dense fiber protein 2-like n=1 Tax=Xenia sp. Carnegie-2017 TaxID=2897299 RepID=UPI001F032FA2|nr:outer dense fiber protein 2-like [Xenia sp. Carnegie-2017]
MKENKLLLDGRVGSSTPLPNNGRRKKERGIPSAVEERIQHSHKRLADAGRRPLKGSIAKSGTHKAHFIPPPARTSPGKNKKISWEGKTHRLDITNAGNLTNTKRSLHIEELNSPEDEDKMRVYERTIGNLMDEIGTLRDEVHSGNGLRSGLKKDEQLNASKRLIEEQEDEISDYRNELQTTLNENKELRTSLDRLRDHANRSRSEVEIVSQERDVLVKKLIETEMDAKSTSHMVLKLKETVNKLKKDHRLSSSDVVTLLRQKESLLRKLNDFETTNKALRKLLKEQSEYEHKGEKHKEKYDLLLQRLAESNEENKNLLLKLNEREKEVEALLTQVNADKNQAFAFDELKKTMELTRAHLQKQLRAREMECERLNVHIKSTEKNHEQDRFEAEHLRGLVEALNVKAQKEKDALKKAARLQKDRASELEKNVETLQTKLDETSLKLRQNHDVTKKKETNYKMEKTSYETKIGKLKSHIHELENELATSQSTAKANNEAWNTKVHTLMKENSSLRSENERLKIEAEGFEERLKAEEERNFAKIDKYRREVDEARVMAQENEDLLNKVKQDGNIETEKVRITMQKRITELEPVAELFKASEHRLQEAHNKIVEYERRTSDHKQLITELTQKVEMQSDQLEETREKWRSAEDCYRDCEKRLESFEAKYEQLMKENRDLIASLSRGDEALKQTQEKLEEKKETVAKLTYQLEAAFADARRQAETLREKNIAKERSSHARIAELEAQLSRATANVAQMKREKDEVEHRYTSRLSDMRDRLDQANTTTRSMQNYVSFLKSSYSTVFDDIDEAR